ncbi:MAG: hypothetical protein ACYSR9_03570 [Planctomycetota bacterium]
MLKPYFAYRMGCAIGRASMLGLDRKAIFWMLFWGLGCIPAHRWAEKLRS